MPLDLDALARQLGRPDQPESRRFHALMERRVKTILMVSTAYEAFSLAWDGSLTEDIYGTYSLLHLQNVPRLATVTSAREALARLRRESYDLVLVSSNLPDMSLEAFGGAVKDVAPGLPVVALVFALGGVPAPARAERYPGIEYVFAWQGSAKVLLSIIKLVEDRLNTDRDIQIVRIGVILVVEDSPRDYSLFLPSLYALLMKQAFARVPFGIDENERQLRTRTRPKIVLACTLAEADACLARYQPFLHGVISDLQVGAAGEAGRRAGAAFLRRVRDAVPGVPVLLMSADETAPRVAAELGIRYADKNSPRCVRQLEEFCMEDLGFGDFVFRDAQGRDLVRARNLREFERALLSAPESSIEFHSRRNDFSHWLLAQGESGLAAAIRPLQSPDFGSVAELRNALHALVSLVRRDKHRATIADFRADDFEPEYAFLLTGRGSLGGKARGLAFLFNRLQEHPAAALPAGVEVRIPRTLVITTDAFDEFMARNELDAFAAECRDDRLLRQRFLDAALPAPLVAQLRAYLRGVRVPLAVRSSSRMEDSSNQPFAGLYQTCMLPNNDPDDAERLRQLVRAVALVYASAFTASVKRYFQTLSLNVQEEKMAVIVQELVGRRRGALFYPTVSGVAQSFNYYPFARMEPDDGVASVALGFGKTVVEGGRALRFCPRYPAVLPQAATPADLAQISQDRFYALRLDGPPLRLAFGKGSDLSLFNLDQAERDQTLQPVGSVISADDTIVDDLGVPGRRVVSFAPLLRHGLFPLPELLQALLDLGKTSLGTHVEIEFAANLDAEPDSQPDFYLLQLRPMVAARDRTAIRLDPHPPDSALCACRAIMGHGVIENVRDIVYCHPRRFEFARSRQAAALIGRLNEELLRAQRPYVLIGPGRWGTRLPALGIPVTWQQVAGAAVIVEVEAPGRRMEVSQGAHFFHNLAATGIGYFTVRGVADADNFVRWERIDAMPAVFEDPLVRHVRAERPFTVVLDAHRRQGLIAPAEPS